MVLLVIATDASFADTGEFFSQLAVVGDGVAGAGCEHEFTEALLSHIVGEVGQQHLAWGGAVGGQAPAWRQQSAKHRFTGARGEQRALHDDLLPVEDRDARGV